MTFWLYNKFNQKVGYYIEINCNEYILIIYNMPVKKVNEHYILGLLHAWQLHQ